MSGDRENATTLPESPPRKYYWPWECRYPIPSYRFSLVALFVFVTMAAFGSCCCGFLVREVEGKRLSPTVANKRLRYVGIHFRVPEIARNVDLRASYAGATISFDISFADYVAFCRLYGVDLRHIQPTRPQLVYDPSGKTINIVNGYYFVVGKRIDRQLRVYFDSDKDRAWVDCPNR